MVALSISTQTGYYLVNGKDLQIEGATGGEVEYEDIDFGFACWGFGCLWKSH